MHLRVEVEPEKVPRISGVFPVGRYGDCADTLLTTPDRRGYVLTTSKSPTDDPPSDGPRHAVYARDSSGHSVGQKVTLSESGRTS